MFDFTQIKLPTIYYHLEKMRADGLLIDNREKEGNSPEKTIYSVTDKGKMEFQNLLNKLLEFNYRPVFPTDAIFCFSDALDSKAIPKYLESYVEKLKSIIVTIQKHKTEILQIVPGEMRVMARIIFRHHELHYRAELDWAVETLKNLI